MSGIFRRIVLISGKKYNFQLFGKLSKDVSVPFASIWKVWNFFLDGKRPVFCSKRFYSTVFSPFLVVWCVQSTFIPFYLFSWPSLMSDSTERKTPAALSPMIRSILRLWCHESCRTYSDRLFTEEQRYWFSSLLHDSVEEFFCRDNSEQGSEMFTVEQVEKEHKSLRGNWTFHSLK